MNKKSLLFNLFIIPFNMLNVGAIIKDDFVLTSDLYGPFEIGNEDLIVEFNASNSNIKSSYYTFGFLIYNDDFSADIGGFESKEYYVGSKDSALVTIKLPLKNFLKKTGEKVEFFIKDHRRINVLTKRFTLYPVLGGTINPMKVNDQTFQGTAFKFNGKLEIYEEHYYFDHNMYSFMPDCYYRLTLENLSFIYEGFAKFKYDKATLMIINSPSCLQSIGTYKDGNIQVPLKMNYLNNLVYFEYAFPFFVEPNTLLTSYLPKEGYQVTKYLYLPKNHLKELLDVRFIISLEGFGPCDRYISWTCDYDVERLMIGDCANSDFCITGGIV